MATQLTSTAARRGGGERFAPGLTLGEARARLFALGGLGDDGGYGDAWVVLKLWRIPFAFPNTEGRRRAVRFHDLHHVLTEYPTTWRAEFEIAAWEVASGVRRYWVGWLLDLLGYAWDGSILARRVGEVRRRLKLDGGEARPTRDDRVAFAFWGGVSVLA